MRGNMGKTAILFWGILPFLWSEARADPKPKTETMYIETDQLPPASAEEVVPKHPFFSEPTTGNEVMEKVMELEERIEELEKQVSQLAEKH